MENSKRAVVSGKTRGKRILALVLLLSMLLSSFGGGIASAAFTKVNTDSELAYDPLAGSSSVAYEQHEDGYTVSLDRAADSVTMRVTGAPGSGRSAEQVRLYIRTGVALKAGVSYQVSFALTAEKAQPNYAVCFDGASAGAYGTLNGRSIEAGGTDRVRYVITPEAEQGELVLRLLLGNTTGNTFRFSDLAVGEAVENETGENVMLVDELNYNAPGFIRSWTNDDSRAVITSDEKSATLTVTQAPTKGAEVWKIKLLVATSLRPEPGKTYRFRADLVSSTAGDYEICFNEGETEKGYGVLYSQKLSTQKQTLDYRIYVPSTQENPGELIVQYSLGKLKTGDQVTVSNVRVEEAIPTYKNALRGDFAFDTTSTTTQYDAYNMAVTSAETVPTSINWTGTSHVSKDGSNAGDLNISGGSATLGIKQSGDPWNAKLFVDTGENLTLGEYYRVSFDIQSDKDYTENCEVLYGNEGGDRIYYGVYDCRPSTTSQTVTRQFLAKEAGKLLITFQIGKTGVGSNSVTVSSFKIEKVAGILSKGIKYPMVNFGTFRIRDNKGALTGDGNSATMTCPDQEGKPEAWQRGLCIDDVCELSAGKEYLVSFDIKANSDNISYEIDYNRDRDFNDNNQPGVKFEKGFGAETGLTASSAVDTHTYPIKAEENGKLRIRLNLGLAAKGTQITVSNIKVMCDGKNIAEVTYPKVESTGSNFELRDNEGTLTGDGTSATMTCPVQGEKKEAWERGLCTGNICSLSAGTEYKISFDIKADRETHYTVSYNKDKDYDTGFEDKFGSKPDATVDSSGATITHTVTPDETGMLRLRINLGCAAEGTQVTISNIVVQDLGADPNPADTKTITSFGSVWAEGIDGYGANLTRYSNQAVLNVTKGSMAPGNWRAKLFIHTGVPYAPGKAYRARFTISATNAQSEFVVISQGVPDSEDIRGTWGLSIGAGETKTITTRPIPAGKGSGDFILQLELGNLNGTENTFTVSNVVVEEVQLAPLLTGAWTEGAVTNDAQPGYHAELVREKEFASLNITQTPATGAEFWKMKMFIDTNVLANANEAFRVIFDVAAEKDMNYEVCYNRGDAEKGYDAIYGLHVEGGKTQTVERVFTTAIPGKIKLQLSLGMVSAPNKVTVRNLRVERITYSYSGKSALATDVNYNAPGAVSFWAHNDYVTSFTNTADSITANIKSAPSKGAEPWKIKLFLDTGTVLQPGKYYKVTANVSAKVAQDFEICYNNGGAEMGYDAMGGLHLTPGQVQTTEKLIAVPAGKKDATNLMLQFNLGKTSVANSVTVSDVTVEEVSLSYAEMMAKGFQYSKSTSLWTNTDYTANLDSAANAATVHITGVPDAGAEVWKVQMKVKTGAVLSAGKTYLVRADMQATKGQNYEVCFNNEETEKGFDALYNQSIAGGRKTTVERKISVPASMTDAGELVLQFSVGGAVANDITVSNISVQEMNFGGSGSSIVPDTVVSLYSAPQTAAGTLDVTREKLVCHMTKISAASADNAVTMAGADLRSGDLYTVAFTAKADKAMSGTVILRQAGGKTVVLSAPFELTTAEKKYSFTTGSRLAEGGSYDLVWQFGSAENQKLGSADVELSNISVYSPGETLEITRSVQKVTVNGKAVSPDIYNINGNNYFKLRDLALLMNDTNGQFVVRYNKNTNAISLTTGKAYTPVGGELKAGADKAASCRRSPQEIAVNGQAVSLKAYNIGGNNYFKLRDLNNLLGFKVDYIAASNTVAITSPLTPEAQEKKHAYDLFFLPEVDGEAQPYVGDTMPYYENGVYYTYYLKEGGDAYNHSVYLTTTKDFVTYTEYDDPVLSASREDVQDNWIGTGSVVKVDQTYYFFYTGFNASGSQEYHEKIMVAKGSSPTSFEKVKGWAITPPDELGQKNDFRDPQAYYDPATGTISLTITAGKDGAARILKYTLGKDLQNVKYDGIIYTDSAGLFWNMECSDTFKIGDTWYLTYSGQDDTLWYAKSSSRFGPYSDPVRLEGKLFYAGKHVEDGKNAYMIGWARRSNSASSTQEVNGWAGNLVAQKLCQHADGSLSLVPVDSIVSSFKTPVTPGATEAALKAGSNYSYKEAFTSTESFMLRGEFTYTGNGSFGLAFDYNGKAEAYKFVSIDPAENKLSLSFNEGTTPVTEMQTTLHPRQTYSFTYIQDGSVGIFYLGDQAALTVRLYGVTDKPIYLFAENNNVTFSSLQQFTK